MTNPSRSLSNGIEQRSGLLDVELSLIHILHMKHIGHPLLGDFLYHPEDHSISRQALHCASLTFTHPITGETLTINAKLPEDMQQLLSQS